MLSSYPKIVQLKDKSEVTIRVLQDTDREKLRQFFELLPSEDLLFMKDDVTDPRIFETIFSGSREMSSLWLIAESEGTITGKGSLINPKHGWRRSVADIHLVVAQEHQRNGLGSALARELLLCAKTMGLSKVSVAMAEEQIDAIKCVEKHGFHKEAVLRNYILDIHENLHNMIVMSFQI